MPQDGQLSARPVSDTGLRLHLGCGKRHIPGFVHVDLDEHPHIDHYHDIRRLPMFEDGSADLVYACHVLEYFDRVEVLDVLKEWHRVLRPGGTIRLAVPDFSALAEAYRRWGDLSKIIGPLFGHIEIDTPEGMKKLFHRTVYDFDTLQNTLETAGFCQVRRYDWADTVHKDHDDFSQAYLPHMDKENGLLISLNVEATK